MKFLKLLLSWFLHIINIPISMIVSFGAIWYALPTLKETIIGETILKVLSETTIFWSTIGSAIFLVISIILGIFLNKNTKSKVKNFFIHLDTWIVCLTALVLSISAFILVNPIITSGITIGIYKKIMIAADLALLVVFHIFSTKISRLINRKIQSYQNSKELNIAGRSSIIWINFLKLIEILFPEILILFLFALIVSWEVACYFTIILLSVLIPMFGNIFCDLNIRKETIKKNNEDHQKLVQDVADRIKEK